MAWTLGEWARRVSTPGRASPAQEQPRHVSPWLHIAGSTLRAVFIACLIVITIRISMPQNETIWTAYDTPADLVRLILGMAVCLWLAAQFFRSPKDAHNWLYFGFLLVPFALLVLYEVW